MTLGHAIGEHGIGAFRGVGMTTLVSGDPSVGGEAVGEVPRFWYVPPHPHWMSEWTVVVDCGWDTHVILKNEATDCSAEVDIADVTPPDGRADIPWKVGTWQFEEGGETYTFSKWRIAWWKKIPAYEEHYDWAECTRCRDDFEPNRWRYYTGDLGCLGCWGGQGGATVPVGTPPTSGKSTLHMVYEFWSSFYNDYRWHVIRRFQRPTPGGLKAPETIGPTYRIQQVWEIISSAQPLDAPRPTGKPLLP
jgi:hypothetical protein